MAVCYDRKGSVAYTAMNSRGHSFTGINLTGIFVFLCVFRALCVAFWIFVPNI